MLPALYPLPRLLTFHFQMGTSCGIDMLKKKQQLYTLAYPVWWGSIAAEFDTSPNLMGLSICPLIWLSAAPPPQQVIGKSVSLRYRAGPRTSEKEEEADRFPGRQRKKDTFLESPHLFHFLNVVAIDGFIGSSFDDVQLNFCDFQHSRLFFPFFKNSKGANK